MSIPGLESLAFSNDSPDVQLIWDSGRLGDLRDISSDLSQSGIPVLNFEAEYFLKSFEKSSNLCPIFGREGKYCGNSGIFRVPENKLFLRFDTYVQNLLYAGEICFVFRPSPFHHDHKYQLFLVLLSSVQSLKNILEAFNGTVLQCPQFIDVGVFHPNNQFHFDAINIPNAAEEVFEYEYFRAISRVSVSESSAKGGAKFIHVFDILQNNISPRCVGSTCTEAEIFTNFDNFGRYSMDVSTMPYSPNVLDSNGHFHEEGSGYWGYEIDMLKEIR